MTHSFQALAREKARAYYPRSARGTYDGFEPTWSCEARERIPDTTGDGPKWVCGIRALKDPCLVYSFGSNGDTSFERAVKKFAPACNIYTFDPTLSRAKRAHVDKAEEQGILTFVNVGISNHDGEFQLGKQKFAAKSLATLRRTLGQETSFVDLFKIDVEGNEYDVFGKNATDTRALAKIGQLQIEIHGI